jgi:hypothetical protein
MLVKALCISVGIFLQASLLACPAGALPGRDPITAAVSCISNAQEGSLTLVNTTECAPCINLLSMLESIQSTSQLSESVRIRMVWLDADPKQCALSAMKHANLGPSVCASIADARAAWKTVETPTAFWMESGALRKAVGTGNASQWVTRFARIKAGFTPNTGGVSGGPGSQNNGLE